MRTTVGQELQRLFAARDRGVVQPDEFLERKALLLEWSGCRFSLFTPRRLRLLDKPAGRLGTSGRRLSRIDDREPDSTV